MPVHFQREKSVFVTVHMFQETLILLTNHDYKFCVRTVANLWQSNSEGEKCLCYNNSVFHRDLTCSIWSADLWGTEEAAEAAEEAGASEEAEEAEQAEQEVVGLVTQSQSVCHTCHTITHTRMNTWQTN